MLYGDLGAETADAYFHYGVSMLKLGRYGTKTPEGRDRRRPRLPRCAALSLSSAS